MTFCPRAWILCRWWFLLGLEQVADAKVEGSADWAAGYIKALQNAGVDFPTNYTQPAKRADLAALAFQADTVITEQREAEKTFELRYDVLPKGLDSLQVVVRWIFSLSLGISCNCRRSGFYAGTAFFKSGLSRFTGW